MGPDYSTRSWRAVPENPQEDPTPPSRARGGSRGPERSGHQKPPRSPISPTPGSLPRTGGRGASGELLNPRNSPRQLLARIPAYAPDEAPAAHYVLEQVDVAVHV